MSYFDQSPYDIRCEWGLEGIRELAPITDLFVIVDVISFSTCTSMAIDRGATVHPFLFRDERAVGVAKSLGAEMAGRRGSGSKFTLEPGSMLKLEKGQKIVLPSPNGSRLSTHVGSVKTVAGCLRNASAIGAFVRAKGIKRVSIIPAGERWTQDETLRPALEDWLGAGAIISGLVGSKSAEALAAEKAFAAMKSELSFFLSKCGTGRELTERGYPDDPAYAAELDVSSLVPLLVDGAYVAAQF